MNEGYVFQILLFRKKPKYKIGNLVRTADLNKTFSKSDTIYEHYKLYKSTESPIDTTPIYHIDKLPERYNEA